MISSSLRRHQRGVGLRLLFASCGRMPRSPFIVYERTRHTPEASLLRCGMGSMNLNAKPYIQSSGLADALFEGSSDCVKIISLDGRIARISNSGLCMLELESAEAILGVEWLSLWPEAHRNDVGDSVTRAAAGEKVRFQGYCPTATGKPKWWDVTVSQVLGDDGHPSALLAVSRDITDLAAARQAILVVDANGLITSWNDQAHAVFGWSATEAIGMAMASLIIPERYRADHTAGMKRFIASGESALMGKALELSALRRTGEEFPVELVLSAIPGTKGWQMMASIQDISARRAQVELFENAFHYAPIALALVSLEGRFLKLNTAFCTLVGYEEQKLLSSDFQTITHPDDLERDLTLLGQLVAGSIADYQMDKRYIRADGSLVWINLSVSMVRHTDGRPKHFIAQVQDLTARRAAEGQYRLLADNVGDIVGLHDLDGRCVYMSPSSARVLGYDPEEMIGRTPFDFMPPEDQAGLIATQAKLASEPAGTVVTHLMRMIRKDREIIWVEVSGRLIKDERGRPVVLAVTRDVSERVESDMRYRLMAENTTDMIVTTTAAGKATFVSPSSVAITGWPATEMLGQRPIEFAYPDDVADLKSAFRKIALGAEGLRLRWRGKHKTEDRWVWLESCPSLLPVSSDPNAPKFLDVIRDVTTQVEQEDALARATAAAEAAAAAKAEFLANMSHEIRTPLTAVLGFTGLLSERRDLGEQSRHFVDRIASASRGLLSIVNDVLDFSKLEAGQFEIKRRSVSAVEMVRDAVMMLNAQADAKSLDLSLSTSVDMAVHVLVDPERVRQVLLNLIGNAVKFTQEGGVKVDLRYEEDRLYIEVRDSGAGLSPEAQQKLFQRFSQVDGSSTKQHGGTGLGLAICKGLVETMGGSIGVRSEVGQGSCFYFDVEAFPAGGASVEGDQAGSSFECIEGVRVLVADDNPVNRELVRAILEGFGADVTEAQDGVEAVEAAQAMPYDVILMDIRMPRLDGIGALQTIRRVPGPNQTVPIIGFSAGADLSRVIDHRFDGFVPKPIEVKCLLEAVSTAAFGAATEPSPEKSHAQ